MSNRETYPSAPIVGDITCLPGNQSTTVVGLQTVPVSSATPSDQNVLKYISNDGQWEPSDDGNGCIQVNGVHVSDDYLVYVNGVFVKVNGVIVA